MSNKYVFDLLWSLQDYPRVLFYSYKNATEAQSFTMDVYSHIIGGMQEDAMERLDGVLPVGVSPQINTKSPPATPN